MRLKTLLIVCSTFVLVVIIAIVISQMYNTNSENQISTVASSIEDKQPMQTEDVSFATTTYDADAFLLASSILQTKSVCFVESSELTLPSIEEHLQFGQPFHLRGTVLSDIPLKNVKVIIKKEKSTDTIYPIEKAVTFNAIDQIMSYSFEDMENDLAVQIPFDKLQPGYYTLIISASTFESENLPLATTEFIVNEPSEWLQLISNNFRNNYTYAMNFFVQKDRFMFKYNWGEGRQIVIDPEWEKTYIVSVPGLNGVKWSVHIDAVPYVEKALEFLNSTYIRVEGNGHDSGIIKLANLIKSFDGAYVSRFVTDKSFISHHAFGTALDINATMAPNNNSLANRDIINDQVTNNLVYDGIKETAGVKYYCFTYNGDWPEYYEDVPESVVNYLLYELAFYRAGFGWGYYYSHTCDAMHYSLSEMDICEHSSVKTGLRKVYNYIK